MSRRTSCRSWSERVALSRPTYILRADGDVRIVVVGDRATDHTVSLHGRRTRRQTRP